MAKTQPGPPFSRMDNCPNVKKATFAENGQMSKSGMATLVRFGQMAKTDRCRSGPTFSSPEKSHNGGRFGPFR